MCMGICMWVGMEGDIFKGVAYVFDLDITVTVTFAHLEIFRCLLLLNYMF